MVYLNGNLLKKEEDGCGFKSMAISKNRITFQKTKLS